jgi:hypothetical protein
MGVGKKGDHKVVVASTGSMHWQHRKLAAEDVARDFSLTAQTFADTFVQYVAAPHGSENPVVIGRRHREACALVWASIEATLRASALTEDEHVKIVPMVRERLIPYWRKYGQDDGAFIERVRERAVDYLRYQEPLSQLKTATGMIRELMASLDPEGANMLPVKTLTAIVAHRMLSDLRRLNELKSGHSIE